MRKNLKLKEFEFQMVLHQYFQQMVEFRQSIELQCFEENDTDL